MKHTIIEKAALKAKSEETGIPFSNLLRLQSPRFDGTLPVPESAVYSIVR